MRFNASLGEDFFVRSWMVTALLAIVAPISLLVTLRLTDVLPEAIPPKITELETVSWNISKPAGSIYPRRPLISTYSQENITLEYVLYVNDYWTKSTSNYDTVEFYPSVEAEVWKGFIHSIAIRVTQIDSDADFDIYITEMKLYNVALHSINNDAEFPYIEVDGVNRPKECLLKTWADWTFPRVKNNIRDSGITITAETTYFDGETYRKVIAPIRFEALASDRNNSFDTAQTVALSNLYEWVYIDSRDKEDYYKIRVNQDQQFRVEMQPPSSPMRSADFDLYIYDKDEVLQASSENEGDGVLEEASVASSYDGWWYIVIKQRNDCGFYSFIATNV